MLLPIIAFILGALFNRIRGGWIFPNFNKPINIVAFGVFTYLVNQCPIQFLTACLMMWLGASIGWGRYIGALGGWEDKPLKEFPAFDEIADEFARVFYPKGSKKYMRLWGFIGLTLRGGLWGFCLTVSHFTVLPLVIGLLMGLCYLICIELARKLINKPGKGWEWGEFLFGGVLWFSCFI